MVSLSFLPLDSWMHTSWLWEKEHHILDADSKYTQPSREYYSSSARYFHLAGPVTELSKAIPLFYQANCFRMEGNMVRPVNSMNVCSLPYFFCCKTSSLIRNSEVQYTMMVDKKFRKFGDVVWTEALHAGKENTYPE